MYSTNPSPFLKASEFHYATLYIDGDGDLNVDGGDGVAWWSRVPQTLALWLEGEGLFGKRLCGCVGVGGGG